MNHLTNCNGIDRAAPGFAGSAKFEQEGMGPS